jgi:hypothetical protein
VAEQHHASGLDPCIIAKPTKRGVNVLGEARHGGKPIIVTAPMTACVEEQCMSACCMDERRDGQHQTGSTVPAMDDEHGRPWQVVTGTGDEPSPEGAVVRPGDGDVFRREREVRRVDLETGPPDAEDPGEHPGHRTARAGGHDRDHGADRNEAKAPSSGCHYGTPNDVTGLRDDRAPGSRWP